MDASSIVLVVFVGLAILAIGATLFMLARTKDECTEKVRSITGLLAVLISVGAISISAIVGIHESRNSNFAPLLTSAFTAVTAVTTAYFGIKAVTNTAAAAMSGKRDGANGDAKSTDGEKSTEPQKEGEGGPVGTEGGVAE